MLEMVPTVPWSQKAKLNISQTLGLYVAIDLEWDESKDNTIDGDFLAYLLDEKLTHAKYYKYNNLLSKS
jgi:hypothetical protein